MAALPASLIVGLALAGCASSASSLIDEERCRVGGGTWRGAYCERGGGGGGY
jgi:hypothetical protein